MRFSVSKSLIVFFAFLIIATDIETVSALVLSATFHELGHLFAMRLFGVRLNEVSLSAYGFCMKYDDSKTTYFTDIVIALSGSIFNLLLIILFSNMKMGYFSQAVTAISSILGCFNLLPIRSLDGGRALFGFISAIADPNVAESLVNITGIASCAAVSALSILLFLESGKNISVLVPMIWLNCVVYKAKMV